MGDASETGVKSASQSRRPRPYPSTHSAHSRHTHTNNRHNTKVRRNISRPQRTRKHGQARNNLTDSIRITPMSCPNPNPSQSLPSPDLASHPSILPACLPDCSGFPNPHWPNHLSSKSRALSMREPRTKKPPPPQDSRGKATDKQTNGLLKDPKSRKINAFFSPAPEENETSV